MKMKGKIDFKNKVLILENKKRRIEIPIYFMKKENRNEESEEDSNNESGDEIYESNEEKEAYSLSESEESEKEIEYNELKI
jgi:hypothetical protein